MTDEVYYYSKSKDESITISEMSDIYVRRALKKNDFKRKEKI